MSLTGWIPDPGMFFLVFLVPVNKRRRNHKRQIDSGEVNAERPFRKIGMACSLQCVNNVTLSENCVMLSDLKNANFML
jgi:hypothetical protein